MSELQPPLVTVITVSFNHADYVAESLRSVIAQDYEAIEYVVIDDGSTDSSTQIIESFRDICTRRFKHFVFVQQLNAGSVATLNRALSLARGEYLFFLDVYKRQPEEIVSADLKLYEAAGLNFGVAQVEVTSLVELDEHLVTLQEALVKLRDAKGLNFAVLMVTDVVRGSSRLLLTSDVPGLGGLPYPKLPDGTLRAAGVVSRKKQLLPALLSALEG